ncbi:polysaccharide deacteylase family 2 protein [Loktanella sp. 5RATIMAR09]|uniref:divergent polysaccharide deacetylase family protein n=1 Tax=Loktanella sp. 5RATIMAR09 TaxID=1225655 RepID=UPI0006EB94FE|nr:polysaccharide deacteylase family 2 protein [Loktanella sp. 5RATIMAR09]
MKGYVKGGLWGLVLGGVGLSGISLANKQPDFATGPAAPQLAAPDMVPAVQTTQLPVPLPSSPDDVPSFADAVPLSVVTPDAEAIPDVPTETAQAPVIVAVEDPAPQAATTTFAPVFDDDAVETADGTPLAAAGQDDTPLSVTPPAIAVESPTGDAAAVAETTTPAPVAEAAPEPQAEAPVEEAAVTEVEASQDALAGVPQEMPVEAPAVDEAEGEAGDETVQAPDETEVVTATPEQTTAPAQETTAQAAAASDQPVIVAQALPQASGGVRINRPGAEPAETEDAVPATAEADEISDDMPALMRFAAPFDATDGLPKIAVILIDTDAMADATPELATLGFAPTVAVNALADGAGDKMTAYRAAGLEVALQADLPSGARPVDVEVAFEAAFQLLPEAAMLFSLGAGAIEDRAVTAQVMQILAADGLGFVTVQRGLSDATRAAEQAGVPAATVLRDVDGGGEDSRAMARALDQAAFRARQTGDVVILGRMTPETVQALRDWAGALDRSTLSIAPVSAILLAQDD